MIEKNGQEEKMKSQVRYIIIIHAIAIFLMSSCNLFTDFEPPKIKILSPTPGEVIYGTVEIIVEARDNKKVSHINLYLDGNHVKSFHDDVFAFTWDLSELNTDAEHTVKARAYDAENNWSEAEVSFLGYGKAPAYPRLLKPANEASIITNNNTLDWEDIADAKCYHLQIDNNQDFSSPFVDNLSIGKSEYTLDTQLKINAMYYWRVRAKYNWSNWSAWSEAWAFMMSLYLWKYQTGGAISSSPAIGFDGTIYFGSHDHYIYALKSNGKLKWKHKTNSRVESSPAIGLDGTIYVSSVDNYLYALDTAGNRKWRYKTMGWIVFSPAIADDGTIYGGSNSGYLYAISTNGFLKWRIKTSDFIDSSPVISSEGTIIMCSNDGKVYAFNPQGNLLWEFATNYWINTSPAIDADGTIYVTTIMKTALFALNPDGTLKWKNCREPGSSSPAIVGGPSSPIIGLDGNIYVGASFGMYAIDPNGIMRWNTYLPVGNLYTPAIGSEGNIYIGSNYPGGYYDADFYALDQQGVPIRKYFIGSTGTSCPAIGSDGTIYVGGMDGCLYALAGFSAGLADTPWPKFQHDNQNTGRFGF